MKKHLVLIVNIVLILAILGGIGFILVKSYNRAQSKNQDTTPTVVSTIDETPTKTEVVHTIGIVQRSDVPNCNSIYQGFIAELAANGYVNQNNINIDYVLREDSDECKAAIQRFIDDDYDLIFTIGPYCTKLAASMTTDIPIVFGAIEEPEQEAFIESNEAPGGNVTGVSDYTPCFEQIDSIKLMFPDTKKIGAIYFATDANSVTQAIIGEKEAQTEQVNIPYSKYPVKEKEEFNSTLETMLEDGVEVIYAPVDSFIYKNIKTVLKFANDNKLPIICGDTDMLEKGCFSTCVINYPSVGCAAGDIALDILYKGADPATTPVAYISECYLHINEKAMKELGVELPDEVMETAYFE